MAKRVLQVVVTGDSSGLSRSLGTANVAAGKFGRSLGGAGRSMGRFVAASAGLYGVGAAISKVGRDTIGFDRSMRNVNSIAQLNERQFGRLEKSVLRLAGKTAQAPETLANGLYDLVSSGFESQDALKVLEASAKAATAGLTETEVSAAAVAAVLNSYEMPASKAAEVSDVLFKTVDRGVISFEALAGSIGEVLPWGNNLGVSLEELGAAVSTLTVKTGGQAEENMTRLKGALVALLKPTKGMKAAYEELGVATGEELIAKSGSLQAALQALEKTTGGNKEAFQKLFPDIRGAAAALLLTGRNSRQASDDLKAFGDASGATDRALQQQSRSISFQWNKIKASVSAAAIEVGTKAIPKIMDAGREIASIFKDDDLDLGEKIGQSLDVVGRHLAPLGRTLSQAFEAAVPKLADAAAAAAPKVAQAFIRGFMDAGVWGKLAIGGLIASKLRGTGTIGAVSGAGRSAGRAYGQSTADAAATYIGGPGFAKFDKAVRGGAAKARAVGKGVLGFQLALGVADAITAEGLNLPQRIHQAASSISLGIIPSPLEGMEKEMEESVKRAQELIQSLAHTNDWRTLETVATNWATFLGDDAESEVKRALATVADSVLLLKGAFDNLPGSVKTEFLLLDEGAQTKIANLGSRLITLGKTETVAKILASDKSAQEKIAALRRALKAIPDEHVNVNVVEHRQTRGGGRARGQGPGARTSRVGARASALFQDDADIRAAEQEREDLDAGFESADRRRERAALRRRIAAPKRAERRKGEKKDDFKRRVQELKRDAREARREVRELNQEIRRGRERSAIDLRIEGLEQARDAKEAIKDIRGELQGLASDAAGRFRAGLERGIDDNLRNTLAAIGNSPEAQELRGLLAGQESDQRGREDSEQARALDEARKALTPAAARLERAKASGNQRFIDVAQSAFDELQRDVIAAEQAISDTARQRRIDALQTQITDREDAANQEADVARASLDQQEADYAASLNAQLTTLADNLNARRTSYAQFVADVQAILGPLGLGFEGSAQHEGTLTPMTPRPSRRARGSRRRRAAGGPVTGGMEYRINEMGEEFFRPSVGGRVVPSGGSRGVTVNHYGDNIYKRQLDQDRVWNKLAFAILTSHAVRA